MFSDGGALSAFAWNNERRGWLRFCAFGAFLWLISAPFVPFSSLMLH